MAASHFVDINKLILKFIQKGKILQQLKNTEKENLSWGLIYMRQYLL